MANKANGFEAMSSGQTLTTGNTGGASGDAITPAVSGGGTLTSTNLHTSPGSAIAVKVFTAVNADTAIMIWSGSDGSATLTTFFRLEDLPGSTPRIVSARNSGGNAASIALTAANKLAWHNTLGAPVFTASAALAADTDYWLRIRVVPGTTTSNGTIEGAYSTDNFATTVQSFSLTNVNAGTSILTGYRFGDLDSGGTLGTAYFDDLTETSNIQPVADASSDQTVDAFDTVALRGGGSSDADGTVVGYAWSLVSNTSSTTPTLDDATLRNPSYEAPADMTGSVQVWGLVVTDDQGAVSDQATVTITVQPHTIWRINAVNEPVKMSRL